MNDQLVAIDKIAKESGLASSALRYYERCGLIGSGARIGGRRHYPSSVVQRLSVIKVCQKIGFSLAEIAELLDGTRGHDGAWREIALARRAEVQRQIGDLQTLLGLIDSALDCECPKLGDCPHLGPKGHLATTGSTDRVTRHPANWPLRSQRQRDSRP
ncbi:MerR family DNA-binding protein [Amycolatopsis sp. H6(2020)]|nr:MerR family DNA-binding protein [Amycolatopsis sp. H6(2020)]